MKRTFGIVAVIIGIVLLILSFYIKNQIASGMSSVNKGTSMMSSNKYTNAAGKEVRGMAQGMADKYAPLVTWTLIGGIAFIVVGGYIAIFGRKKSR